MFNFTPLLGALSASPASQSLLEFEGGVKVLIDVGWDETFDVAQLKSLERWVILNHVSSFGTCVASVSCGASGCTSSEIETMKHSLHVDHDRFSYQNELND